MIFSENEVCLTDSVNDYTASVSYNGDFYQARIISPPRSNWHEIGIGKTRSDAVTNLVTKIGKDVV